MATKQTPSPRIPTPAPRRAGPTSPGPARIINGQDVDERGFIHAASREFGKQHAWERPRQRRRQS